MKTNFFTGLSILTLLFAGPALVYASTAEIDALKKAFQSVRAPELPARAAQIVSQTKPDEQEQKAEAVLRAALSVRPASGPAVVGAISRSVPAVAPLLAVIGVEVQPKMAGPIIKAAATAAPDQAGKIVYRISKEFPKQYRIAALAAAEGAPKAAPEILAALGSALPNLKPAIEAALAGQPSGQVSVPAVLAAVEPASQPNRRDILAAQALTPQPPPIVGEPFTPGGGTPGEIKRSQTVIVTPGSGRDYSKP
jgi:hypothetical protein